MEFYYLAAEGNSDCQNLLKSEKLDQIMNQKYDVFLTEYFETECALGIAYKLKIPVFVGLSSW